MKYCSVNGKEVENIDVTDRGLAYGDGLFTTGLIKQFTVIELDSHLKRLEQGCRQLKIFSPDLELLAEHLEITAKNYDLAVFKIMITAGQGGRGYSRKGVIEPSVIVTVSDFPEHYIQWQQQGISLGIAETQLGINPQLAGLKHLNRLEQILVRQELDQSSYQDVVVTNYLGDVIEASAGNLFWYKNNQWFTPELLVSGVNGLYRQKILTQLANIKQVKQTVESLQDAEAMFICNSVMEIVPITTFLSCRLNLAPVLALKGLIDA